MENKDQQHENRQTNSDSEENQEHLNSNNSAHQPQNQIEEKDKPLSSSKERTPQDQKQKDIYAKAYMNNSLSTIEGDNSMFYNENPAAQNKEESESQQKPQATEQPPKFPNKRKKYAK